MSDVMPRNALSLGALLRALKDLGPINSKMSNLPVAILTRKGVVYLGPAVTVQDDRILIDTTERRSKGFWKDAKNPRFPKTEGLPPDGDGMNDDRAQWAENAIEAFAAETGSDRNDGTGKDDAFHDLLQDMIHWCDRYGVDFDEAVARAKSGYRDETMEF